MTVSALRDMCLPPRQHAWMHKHHELLQANKNCLINKPCPLFLSWGSEGHEIPPTDYHFMSSRVAEDQFWGDSATINLLTLTAIEQIKFDPRSNDVVWQLANDCECFCFWGVVLLHGNSTFGHMSIWYAELLLNIIYLCMVFIFIVMHRDLYSKPPIRPWTWKKDFFKRTRKSALTSRKF